jgi:TrmH family RNA methyltransferase
LSILAFICNKLDTSEQVYALAAQATACLNRRNVNELRHAILRELNVAQADWDFIDPDSGELSERARQVNPGMHLFLEDIRSPFNVGTIFRTAEAFGVERLYLSDQCASPHHARAERSAMGAIRVLPWETLSHVADYSLASQPGVEIFALELGGEDIRDFRFPQRGLCVLGSEELGVRPETLNLPGLRKVSIPMSGAKASINVAVATGILLAAWRQAINA